MTRCRSKPRSETTLQSVAAPSDAARIRELNDSFRQTFIGGAVVITPGIEALAAPIRSEVLRQVRTYSQFDAANDPHTEHDFGSFDIGDQRIFWKIDYYDRDVRLGSEDPSDSTK